MNELMKMFIIIKTMPIIWRTRNFIRFHARRYVNRLLLHENWKVKEILSTKLPASNWFCVIFNFWLITMQQSKIPRKKVNKQLLRIFWRRRTLEIHTNNKTNTPKEKCEIWRQYERNVKWHWLRVEKFSETFLWDNLLLFLWQYHAKLNTMDFCFSK